MPQCKASQGLCNGSAELPDEFRQVTAGEAAEGGGRNCLRGLRVAELASRSARMIVLRGCDGLRPELVRHPLWRFAGPPCRPRHVGGLDTALLSLPRTSRCSAPRVVVALLRNR